MSELQARLILSACRRIGGTGTLWNATDEISKKLADAGFKDHDSRFFDYHGGSLYVKGT